MLRRKARPAVAARDPIKTRADDWRKRPARRKPFDGDPYEKASFLNRRAGAEESATGRSAAHRRLRGGCRRPLQIRICHGRGCGGIAPATQMGLSLASHLELARRT